MCPQLWRGGFEQRRRHELGEWRNLDAALFLVYWVVAQTHSHRVCTEEDVTRDISKDSRLQGLVMG